jgi:hypothetical protein
MSRSTRARDPGPFAALAVAIAILPALSNPVHAAGGAFVVDDSEVGKSGECKIESWASFASNADFLGVTSPSCVANLGQPVEFGFALARFRADGEWGSELLVKGKTSILSVETGKLGVALSGGVAFDLVTEDHSASTINVPATFQVSKQFKINVNAGWLYVRAEDLNWVTYGAGFEWNLVKSVTLIGEVFGLAGQNVEPSSRTNPRRQLGLRFTAVESIDIDLIYGHNIFGENANWITVGLNVRFDAK